MATGFDYKDGNMPTEKERPASHYHFFKTIVLLLLIGSNAPRELFPVSAAELKNEYDGYVHRSWTTENGLPQNTIYALAQTSDGYLWIGSEGGLARFDGFGFTVFNRSNTQAILKNSITSLCPDRDGSLWIGTFGGGLLNFRAGKFARVQGLDSDLIWSIRQDSAGALWVVTADNGIYCLEEGESPALVIAEGIPDQRITAIGKDDNGAIWIGTRNGLVSIKDGKKKLFNSQRGLAGDYVYCLFADSRKSMWVGTTTGLSRIDDDGIRNFTTRDGLADDLVRTIGEDPLGRLWIGTEKGVTIMERGDPAVCFTPDGLAGNSVMAICRDREDNMWVGTSASGLNFVKKNEVSVYATGDGLSSQQVRPICEDPRGGLWVGTNDQGLNHFSDGRWRRYTTRDGLHNDAITSLLVDGRGRLWIGTREPVLQRLEEGKFSNLQQPHGRAAAPVLSLFMDREGSMWIGSDGGGLERWRDGEWQHHGLARGLKGDVILALAEDRRGGLWAGSSREGLHVMRNGTWRQFTTADGLAGDTVYAIHIDEKDDIWLATNGGLNRLHDGKLLNFRPWPGPLTGTIFQILADDHGYLWFSSPAGIFRVKRSELNLSLPGAENGLHCRRFTEMSGMKSTVCAGGFQPAGCKTRDGRLWFPTQKGLVMIDPKTLGAVSYLAPIRIEKILANGRAVGFPGAKRFPPGTDRFDFSFTAIRFADPQQIEFATRLEGLEDDWNRPGPQRDRRFVDLAAGSYTFRVRARGQDGIWNESLDRFHFMIEPYFYRTAWFYLLILTGSGVAASGLLYIRRRSARKRKSEKYKFSTLSSDKTSEYTRLLEKAIEQDKLYLDPDLTLAKLAEASAIPAKHLSQLINERYELNFNDFVNRYRVEEAKRRLLAPAARDCKLLRIAFEAGFNSKSVFNIAFKKNTGLSPSEFRKLLGEGATAGDS